MGTAAELVCPEKKGIVFTYIRGNIAEFLMKRQLIVLSIVADENTDIKDVALLSVFTQGEDEVLIVTKTEDNIFAALVGAIQSAGLDQTKFVSIRTVGSPGVI